MDRVVGLEGVEVDYAFMPTPDGHGRLELISFARRRTRSQAARAGERPGIRHVAFAVEDIDAVVARLQADGADLVGEVENYEDIYRLCYVRGPEGIIVELAERIG